MCAVGMSRREEKLMVEKREVKGPTKGLHLFPPSRNNNNTANSLLWNVVLLFWDRYLELEH